ncbi:hypothetical protein [Pedobacter suwonensis]|uniref:hypothetical protein n=1 Tax=Pedobacter suwonensis TaxID=332999 RepID=UPI0011AAFF73|nr:hypothetical protein [Pedobacter suwonensis]
MSDGTVLDLEKLLLAPFDELQPLNIAISSLSIAQKKQIKELMAYSTLQPLIASFFMKQQEIELSSCYYCNIDSIYAFSEFGEYSNALDFIRRASGAQLQLIKGIGEVTAKNILDARKRKQFDSMDDCPVYPSIRTAIEARHHNATHNHFTLDHFYHQSEHHYLRLCLYNFIPCCYACNSKFKSAKKIYSTSATLSSPTSAAFSFHQDVRFKLYLSVAEHDVKHLDDFMVDLIMVNNPTAHANFISVLKLQGRYFHYKREALRLLMLKKEYPDSVITELADSLGKSPDELRKNLFGAELYDTNLSNSSLVKYKRDIARDINLLAF